MASLYRPLIVAYTLPDGKRVTKHTPGVVRTVTRSKTWWGRSTDGAKQRHQVPLSQSKEVARRMLAKLAGDAQLAGVGIRDPFAEHRGRPLADHAEDFGRYLSAKGDTPDHVKRTVARCRAVLYPLAARAGLRASELASLTPSSFDFDAPSVVVEAAHSKRRRKDVQPLPADVAELLRQYVKGRPAAAPLWPGTWPEVGAEMVRLDLAAAGIPYIDADGLAYDFHALRHQFITDMVNAGVHPKDAQALARYSTITLTMDRYAHVRPANLHAALDRLSPLAGQAADKPGGGRRKKA